MSLKVIMIKKYTNISIDEKLSNIKLFGKILFKCNKIYYDICCDFFGPTPLGANLK